MMPNDLKIIRNLTFRLYHPVGPTVYQWKNSNCATINTITEDII